MIYKFSLNGKFGQNGKLGQNGEVQLDSNVSRFTHNCGCMVDGGNTFAAI